MHYLVMIKLGNCKTQWALATCNYVGGQKVEAVISTEARFLFFCRHHGEKNMISKKSSNPMRVFRLWEQY